jgi:hypothetical protein
MNSPFYDSEQRSIFPYRDSTIYNKLDAAKHMKSLIDKGVETLESLTNTPLGKLKLQYFNNCNCFTILDAILLIKDN